MEKQYYDLKNLSENALEEQRKFWESETKNVKNLPVLYDTYLQRIREVNIEINKRKSDKAEKAIDNLSNSSVDEIEDAIRVTEQLRDAQILGNEEWTKYNDNLTKAKEYLKSYNDQVKEASMNARLSTIDQSSTASLEEQRKYWQAVVDGTEKSSPKMQTYVENLEKVIDEERRRKDLNISDIVEKTSKGWNESVKSTEEAIRSMKEFRATLDVGDAESLKEVDDVIAQLNEKLRQSKEGFMSLDDALTKSEEISSGVYPSTIKELEELRQKLMEVRKTSVDLGGITAANDIEKLDKAISELDKRIISANSNIQDFDGFMRHLNEKSMAELQAAASQLNEELKHTSANTKEFTQKSEQLRKVNDRIKELNKQWGTHSNVIARTSKRLASYILVYTGFNKVFGYIKQVISENLKLSDSFADIQKTTGMTSDEVSRLSRSIDAIDTRTAQLELHNLAAVAGQLGLRGQTDVLGFVKASNMISVSLNELGSDGTASLMKLAQLTGDIQKMGVEKSLLSIGSAINELSANSSATAGPIVDIMSRMGGIAAQSKITSAELAAIGATADQLGQNMEITGTSMNKFINALMTNTEGIAYALNLNAKSLQQQIDQGKTMDAIITVFRRLNEMGQENGFKALSSVMKDLGSEGARMMQLLATMAGGVGYLEDNVRLATQAFAEMTSIENEYNVKNENAIAYIERMQNMLKELFVNSDPVSWITKAAKAMHSFLKSLLDGGNAFQLTVAAAASVGAAFLTLKVRALTLQLGLKRLLVHTKNLSFGMRALAVSAGLVKSALLNFGIPALVTAATGLVAYFISAKDKMSALTKAISEHNRELMLEQSRIDAVRNAVLRENISQEERSKFIRQINKDYGQYLGYLIDESDSNERIAASLRLINAELERRMSLTLKTKMEDMISEKYADRFKQISDSISKSAEEFTKEGVSNTQKLMDIMYTISEEYAKNTGMDIHDTLINALKDINGNDDGGGMLFYNMKKSIIEYAKARKEYSNEVEAAEQMAEINMKRSNQKVMNERTKVLADMKEEYQKLSGMDMSDKDEDTQREYYERLLRYEKDYISLSKKQLEEGSDYNKEVLNAEIAEFEEYQKATTAKLKPLRDEWGKGPNLVGWREALREIESGADLSTESLDKLANAYKNIQEESKKISDVDKYNAMFGTQFTSLKQAMEDAYEKAKIIRAKLKEYNRGVDGDFLWPSEKKGNRDAKQKVREEYQAALSALEAYYAERETVIRRKMLEQGASEAETNRQLENLNVEHWNDQKQLYKTLLEKFYKESTFDKKKFVGPLSNLDYFTDKDLDTLRVQLARWGVAMEDGMTNKLMQIDNKIAEQAQKIKKRIDDILLNDDYNAKVLKEYTENLDQLGLLYNLYTESESERTDENNRRRMTLLRSFADDSYKMDAAKLKARMGQYETFQQWMTGRSSQDYEALLVMLRKYYDDVSEADRQQAERRKRIIESNAAAIGLEAAGKKADQRKDTTENRLSGFEQLGIVSENPKEQLQIDYYKQKISLAEQYIELIQREMMAERMKASVTMEELQKEIAARKQAGLDTSLQETQLLAVKQQVASLERQELQLTADKRNEITEQTEQLNQVFMEREQRKLTEVKKYTDALVTFAEDMGEAAFGEVEDRKEAGRQLIKSLLTTLKDWAQVKLTELAMKQMFANQSAAIAGQEAVVDLTMQGAKTSADVKAGIASATAKEAGKLGLGGLLVGAAIGAALSALLAAAMSQIGKSKSEVSSASKTSTRLATGMLTYASGRYPVLGNDGKLYDAQLESGSLRTGIYRGGAHAAVFSERQPEAVIDGRTTQRLVMDYPHLWNAILNLSRYGTLTAGRRGVRTYAQGNLEEIPAATSTADITGLMKNNERMAAALEQSNAIQSQLIKMLSKPIQAKINMYGTGGLQQSMRKADKFASSRKIG